MTSWDIDPQGVQTALSATHTAAMPLEQHAKAYGAAVEAVFPEVGDRVAFNLSEFATHFQHAFSDITAQIIASLNGAADATVAYMNGQQTMALAAQRNSRDAAYKASEQRRLGPGGQAGAAGAEQAAADAEKESHEPTVVERAVDSVGEYVGDVFGGGDKTASDKKASDKKASDKKASD
jgi:uncharacterized protein DUF6507